jgi:glycylpeptide N-tetradecanoyltransferase
MAEPKEQDPPATEDDPKVTIPAHSDDDSSDDEKPPTSPRQAEASKASKSKKKKKKSKLRSLLDRKPNEDIQLSEVEEALKSVTVEERKTLTKDQAKKLEFMIKKMNEFMPGGRKQMGDHKFWKTQPVIRFGRATVGGRGLMGR